MLHTYNTDTHFDPNIVVTCNAQVITLTMPIRKSYSGCDKLRISVKGYFMKYKIVEYKWKLLCCLHFSDTKYFLSYGNVLFTLQWLQSFLVIWQRVVSIQSSECRYGRIQMRGKKRSW